MVILNKNTIKLFFLLIFTSSFANCQSRSSYLSNIGNLPELISEASGIESLPTNIGFWAINDSGNSNDIFLIDIKGKLKQVVEVTNAKNKDWEDLASNGKSMLYIGDFGNNENLRKDLTIYSINLNTIRKNKVNSLKTKFIYEDQIRFPPKKKKRNFDVEAFIYYKKYFYLFSKNRSSEFDGTTKLYKVPAKEGKQVAIKIGTFRTCYNKHNCMVTGADISDDGKQLVLLTHNSIFLFSDYKNDAFFEGKYREIDLMHNSQKEAICFVGNTLYIMDEKTKISGGNLYKLKSLERIINAK